MPYDVSCHVYPVITLIGEPDISLNITVDPLVSLTTTTTIEQTNAMTAQHTCRDTTTVAYTHVPRITVQLNGSQDKIIEGAISSGSKTVITTS